MLHQISAVHWPLSKRVRIGAAGILFHARVSRREYLHTISAFSGGISNGAVPKMHEG